MGTTKTRNLKLLTGFTLLTGIAGGLFGINSAYANLEYRTSFGLNFTVNDSITLTVPSTGLVINGLAPGTTADSQTITVNVLSNSSFGYVLNATVGNTTYTDRNLWHENYAAATPVTNVFSSIAYAATPTVTTLTTPNTWGYSYSTDGGTNWANYNGLPLYTDTTNIATLKETNTISAAAGDNVNFKIAAYAGVGQASGEYNNVINFEAVAKPNPALYMQDVATWGSTVVQGDVVQAEDMRDGKKYYVARLADNNLWMTQNLDYDIVNGGIAINSLNTDVPSNWADAGTLTDTYASNNDTWNVDYTSPESYDPGDLCWDGVIGSEAAVACSQNDGSHYHLGNYYNWTAAVAMGNSSGIPGGAVDQSICPAGWRLPPGSGNKSLDALVVAANLIGGHAGNVQSAPVYFVYGGGKNPWDGEEGLYEFTVRGSYWTNEAGGGDWAVALGLFEENSVTYGDSRADGYSVRCVAR